MVFGTKDYDLKENQFYTRSRVLIKELSKKAIKKEIDGMFKQFK